MLYFIFRYFLKFLSKQFLRTFSRYQSDLLPLVIIVRFLVKLQTMWLTWHSTFQDNTDSRDITDMVTWWHGTVGRLQTVWTNVKLGHTAQYRQYRHTMLFIDRGCHNKISLCLIGSNIMNVLTLTRDHSLARNVLACFQLHIICGDTNACTQETGHLRVRRVTNFGGQ